MNFRPVQTAEIKISVCPSSEYETDDSFESDLVEKSETFDFFCRLVPFPYAARKDVGLVRLTIMAAHFLLVIAVRQRFRVRMTRYASGIRMVRLFQSGFDPGVLGQISVRHGDHIGVFFLQPFVECPTHDAHEGCIPVGSSSSDGIRKFDLSKVISTVTGFAERDQIVRRISSGLPAFDVVHIQDRVLGSALAALTDVAVPEQDVFPRVPEGQLRTGLVVRSVRERKAFLTGLQELCVERCRLDGDVGDRKDFRHLPDDLEMRGDFRLHGRGQPTLVLGTYPVEKPGLSVPRLPVSSASAVLSSFRDELGYVGTKFDFGRIDFFRPGTGRDSDDFAPGIDAEIDGLCELCGLIQQLNGERFQSSDFCKFAFQHPPDAAVPCRRHKRLTVQADYVYRFQAIRPPSFGHVLCSDKAAHMRP